MMGFLLGMNLFLVNFATVLIWVRYPKPLWATVVLTGAVLSGDILSVVVLIVSRKVKKLRGWG